MLERIFRHSNRAVIGWAAFFLPLGLISAAVNTPHAKVTLVSRVASIQPGQTFQLGLYFELEKGWHIYWINPGDSGEPPRVEWKLPPEFHAGPLIWPAPRRLENGPLVDFGYENEVLLISAIRAPAIPKTGSAVKLQASVKWLVCHDICIPERETVALSLPVRADAPKTDSRWHELFARTRAQLPRLLPKGWSVDAVSGPDSFVLSVKTGTREPNALFFPLNPLQLKNAASQRSEPFDEGIRLSLRKSDQLMHPVAFLKGILVLSHGEAYAIEVPVTSLDRPGKL